MIAFNMKTVLFSLVVLSGAISFCFANCPHHPTFDQEAPFRNARNFGQQDFGLRIPPFVNSKPDLPPFMQPSAATRSQFDLHNPVHVSRILEALMQLPAETKEYLSKFVNALIPYVSQDLDLLTALTVMRNHLHQTIPLEQMTRQFRPSFGGAGLPFQMVPLFRPEVPADFMNGSSEPAIPNQNIEPNFFPDEEKENMYRADGPEDSISLDFQDQPFASAAATAANSSTIVPKVGQNAASKVTEAVKPAVDSANTVADNLGIQI